MADDRSTRARIRDAAITVIAEHGVAAATARRVAEVAEVSPGSVINHFGSMDDLRKACDHHVAALIRERKQAAMAQGPGLDVLGAMRDQRSALPPLLGYLAQVLHEDGEAVNDLVDEMAEDTVGYLRTGIESGIIRPLDDLEPVGRLLTIWSLGGLVLHGHVQRLLGVDLADPDAPPSSFAQYAAAGYALLGEGLFTDEFLERTRTAFAEARDDEAPLTPTPTTDQLHDTE